MSATPEWVAGRVSQFGAVEIHDAAGVPIALVYDQENATVVTAAPELLDALREMIEARDACVEMLDADDPSNAARIERVQAAWRDARIALAKAEGKS